MSSHGPIFLGSFASRPGLCLGGLLLVGCSGTSTSKSGAPPEVAMSSLIQGAALYGYAYEAPPPEGERFRLVVHTSDAGSACALHAEGDPSGEFWYLAADLSSPSQGKFVVGPGDTSPSSCTVRLVHVVGGEKADRYNAVDGTVSIGTPPLVHGDPWKVTILAGFAGQARSIECEEVVEVATGSTTGSCACSLDDGSTTTCEIVDDTDCCLSLGSTKATTWFEASYTSEYCANLCAYTSPELARYCAQ